MKRSTTIATTGQDDDSSEGAANDVMISVAATLQHVGMLYARARKLDDLRVGGENQFLHRVGATYRAGGLGLPELVEIHRQYRQLELPSKSTRWNSAIPVPWARMRLADEWLPNGPAGTWMGLWPMQYPATSPFPGLAVVYVLFDAQNEPVYVGSTGDLRTRLKKHAKDGKRFAFWHAHPAKDREDAYRLETKLLREYLPKLNKKAGR